jgi:hypothetical protein
LKTIGTLLSLGHNRFCGLAYSLAMSQEAHIVEKCGNKSTRELKLLLESLIDTAN